MEKKRKISTASLQGIMLTLVVILFFTAVILIYYRMLYSETRERIIRTGEMNALSSAKQIDDYLSTGVDTLRLACYTLDKMIRDGRSTEEILDFLTNQSYAIENITNRDSTGLYAVIGGTYLDGTGWTPEDDYVPMERPWYIDARANIGQVAIVDPYLDLDTHTIMISLAKTLCDTKSVAAMDMSMEQLQFIAEEIAANGESDIEIVLNRKFQVIAHSDRSEVGKDYFKETDSFAAALVDKLRSTDESYFSMIYGGQEYIVYTVPVASDWMCLSVSNATLAFGQLRKMLIFTLIAMLLVIAAVIIIMTYSMRKRRLAMELSNDLSRAKSDIVEKDVEIGKISHVAFRDALTGVGSKAAYNKLKDETSEIFENGEEELAILMMDVNDLKYINDSFGHDAGDSYIKGCCNLACNIFKRSPIFRLGGDEFVIVLRGEDYDDRDILAGQLKEALERSRTQEDVQPWERYSAAIGVAEIMSGDTGLEDVFKRADKAMYEAKALFKARYGSYR